MSEQREVTEIKSPVSLRNKPWLEMTKDERRARLIEIRDRGAAIDRLHVDVPPTVYQQWVPDNPIDIANYKLMGFEFDTEYAVLSNTHGTKDGKIVMGDVVSMVAPIEVREMIDLLALEKYEEMHGPIGSGDVDTQSEEKEARGRAEVGGAGLQPLAQGINIVREESKSSVVTGEALQQELKSP